MSSREFLGDHCKWNSLLRLDCNLKPNRSERERERERQVRLEESQRERERNGGRGREGLKDREEVMSAAFRK